MLSISQRQEVQQKAQLTINMSKYSSLKMQQYNKNQKEQENNRKDAEMKGKDVTKSRQKQMRLNGLNPVDELLLEEEEEMHLEDESWSNEISIEEENEESRINLNELMSDIFNLENRCDQTNNNDSRSIFQLHSNVYQQSAAANVTCMVQLMPHSADLFQQQSTQLLSSFAQPNESLSIDNFGHNITDTLLFAGCADNTIPMHSLFHKKQDATVDLQQTPIDESCLFAMEQTNEFSTVFPLNKEVSQRLHVFQTNGVSNDQQIFISEKNTTSFGLVFPQASRQYETVMLSQMSNQEVFTKPSLQRQNVQQLNKNERFEVMCTQRESNRIEFTQGCSQPSFQVDSNKDNIEIEINLDYFRDHSQNKHSANTAFGLIFQ